MTLEKLKVVTVLGTRPEIIRLSRVMAKLDRYCDHVCIHTGQNYDYELNEIFFDDLGVRKPDHFLGAAGKTGSETIGKVIIGVDSLLEELKPEAMLVLGDTNSCLAVIPAKRRKIPVFHMEAGNRCFDQRVPEEINRRIVDHTADINLTYSSIAREYLLREGLPPDMVIKTGSPMFEVLAHHRAGIDASDVLDRLKLKPSGFFVVSAHREENVDPDTTFPEAGRRAECARRRLQAPGDRLDASAHTEEDRRNGHCLRPSRSSSQAARLQGLCQAPAERARRPFR
jgi:UDP-N-acetylglucosamine 2-epimerase